MRTRDAFFASKQMVCVAALAWGLLANPAAAQNQAQSGASDTANDADSQDIIVTATLRASSAQSVPLALTAINGDQLRESGVTGAGGLSRVAPSLVVNESISSGSPRFSLRGLSSGDVTPASSPSIATYIDDVVQTALYGIGAGIFDIQRVEVLRGPQGTTFGKNTTGGAVSYFSQTPVNRNEGYVTARVGFGDRPERSIEGAINVPIVDDKLAARFSFRSEERDDYLTNVGPDGGERGGGHMFSGRAQLRWTPDEDTVVNLALYGSRGRYDQPPVFAEADDFPSSLVFPAAANRRQVNYTAAKDYFDNYNNEAVTLRMSHNFGDFELTSITHYRHSTQNISQDLDGSSYDLFYYKSNSDATQYGQELRLAFEASPSIRGVVGGYFEDSKIDEQRVDASTQYGVAGVPGPFRYIFDPDGPGPINVGDPIQLYDFADPGAYRTTTKTYAVFGNLTVEPVEGLSVTGGLRYTVEKKRFSGVNYYYYFPQIDFTPGNVLIDFDAPPGTPDQVQTFNIPLRSDPLTWDVTVDYKPRPGMLVFARVAKGFRSGGFNQPFLQFPWSPLFNPAPPGSPLTCPPVPLFPGAQPPNFPVCTPPAFAGEQVRSYELGIKSTLFGMLRLNATVYHYDYTDQQVTTYAPNLNTVNAGSSKVDGVEVELQASPGNFDLSGSVSYNRARYESFFSPGDPACFRTVPTTPCTAGVADFSGKTLNQAPRWSANWSIAYHLPVSSTYNVRLATNWSYRSRIYFTADNRLTMSDPDLLTGAVRVSLQPVEDTGFTVAGFVNNISNQRRLVFAFDEPAPGYNGKYYGFGRTFGVEASYRW